MSGYVSAEGIHSSLLLEGEPGSDARVLAVLNVFLAPLSREEITRVMTFEEVEPFALLALYHGGALARQLAQDMMLDWARKDGDAINNPEIIERLALWGIVWTGYTWTIAGGAR